MSYHRFVDITMSICEKATTALIFTNILATFNVVDLARFKGIRRIFG